MSICVIFNPFARGQKALRFKRHLEELGISCALKPTTHAGAGRSLAAEAVAEGHETIVAAGGDGTLNEVVNGIVDAPDGLRKARLGVLPLGTINVFAKEMCLPADFSRAWQVVRHGREISVDVAQATFINEKGREEVRCFVQMAGCGWDARAVQLVNWKLKKKIGGGAYILSGLQALNQPQPTITVSNGTESFQGEMVIIGNGKLYGGKFPLCHQADYQDGILDAILFEKVSWNKLPAYLLQWLAGRLYKPGVTCYVRAPKLSLTSQDETWIHLEGELAGRLPATISILPWQLRVLVPGKEGSGGVAQ